MSTPGKLITILTLILALSSPLIAAQECSPTQSMHLGNNYIANVAKMNNTPGEGLVIEGVIISSSDCQPIADAVVEIWNAGSDGTYPMNLRAFTLSHPDGRFKFTTEWPNMTIPHIHFIVTAENHSRLITQWIPDEKTEHATFNMTLKPQFSL